MEITKDKVVSVAYELRKDSEKGDVVEKVNQEQPLTFLYGNGNLLPKFEENLSGLKSGDSFSFLLPSDDAYGPVLENAIVHVPKNIFEIDGKIDENILQTGNMVPMMDKDGRRLNGKILEIEDEVVKMDFNHPMAGSDLHFTGEVTEIREATEEELAHGHAHNDKNCEDCGEDGKDCNC